MQAFGRVWQFLDYRDKLPLHADRAARFGLEPGSPEDRQCLCLGVAAGVEHLVTVAEPPMEDVLERATGLLQELEHNALQAEARLADPPPWMPGLENEARVHCHDIFNPHHEKGGQARGN